MPILKCVVDANVALKTILEQDLSDEATHLLGAMAEVSRAEFHVPDLFFAEIANVLAWYTRLPKENIGREYATDSLNDLRELPWRVTNNRALIETALGIAIDYRISGYDATYVALAAHLDVALITADRKLINAMKGLPYDIRWLGDLARS